MYVRPQYRGSGFGKLMLRHLEDYLGLDRSFNINWLDINQMVYPPFERTVLDAHPYLDPFRLHEDVRCARDARQCGR